MHENTIAINKSSVKPAADPPGFQADKKIQQQDEAPIQCKLTVGAVDDPLETEADAMADKVMRMPEQNFIQKKCAHCEAEEKVSRKPLASFIQRKALSGADTASDTVSSGIAATKGGGNPLSGNTKTFMESRMGADFSTVRIHTGSNAADLSTALGAQAFTTGNDIYFNEGKYQPESENGKRLLAHELTHVVQQGKGVNRMIQRAPWGVCPEAESLSATNPFVYGAAELLAIAHYKSRNSGHVVLTNKELEIGVSMTQLPPREQRIYNQIREGFHRDKNPQKRRAVALPDKVTERPEATGEALEGAFQLTQQLLQPDIMDLTSLEIYDVTTLKQRDKKLNKILATTYVPRLKALTGLNWKAGKSLTPMVPFIVPILPSKDKAICFGATDFDTHPGVIAYEGLKYDLSKLKKPDETEKPKENEKPKEKEKAKAKGGAYNVGLGISILSSSAGAGNAGVGIAIMSDGVSFGTLSGGVVYNSQGAAVGVVSGGLSSDSMAAGAGNVGLGTSQGNTGASAGTAAIGNGKDNTVANAGTATEGDSEGVMDAQAGASGSSGEKADGNQTGTPLKQAVQMDETLKNATPAQRKLLAKMAQTQGGSYQAPDAAWVSDFLQSTKDITEADVDRISNGTTGNAAKDLVNIKQATGKTDNGEGKGDGQGKVKGVKEPGSTAANTMGAVDQFKKLNELSRKKISEAPAPVAELFKDFTGGTAGDLVLTDDMVDKFFEAVPADLTQEEVVALKAAWASSKGMAPEDLIAALKKSIGSIRAAKDKTSVSVQDNSGAVDGTLSKDAFAKQMLERIRQYKGWDITKGFYLEPSGDNKLETVALNTEFPAVVYQWIWMHNGDKKTKMKSALYIKAKVLSREKTFIVVEITYSSGRVTQDGTVGAGLQVGEKLSGSLHQ